MKHTNHRNLFLDHGSTTPLRDSMKSYLTSLLEFYGNPSSTHSLGDAPRQLIARARDQTADFIHALPEEICFTPSGSAGATLAVKGLASDDPLKNEYEIFYSPTAHMSMVLACRSCRHHTSLEVNPEGEIDLTALDDLLTRHGMLKPLVCVEAASSETGAIQNVAALGSIVKKHRGILVLDATGYIPFFQVDMALWREYVDLLIFSGHKLQALKGTGVLWKKKGLTLKPLVYGNQEQGLVGGTENVLGIASLGRALEEYDYSSITSRSRDYVYDFLTRTVPDCRLAGPSPSSGRRLPLNLFLCFPGVEGESLMLLLDTEGIQVSTGSACHSGDRSPSLALKSLGMDEPSVHSCIRLTFSGSETQEELDFVCATVKNCVEKLRKKSR